jgi:hypothetical protein
VRWPNLNDEQKALLAAWFILADAEKPLTEDLPLEFSTAIAELAAAAGKYHPRRFIRQHMEVGVPVNRRRRVRARKRRGQLA